MRERILLCSLQCWFYFLRMHNMSDDIKQARCRLAAAYQAHAFWCGRVKQGNRHWHEIDVREEVKARKRVQALEAELFALVGQGRGL